MTTVSSTFSEMHQWVKRWHTPPNPHLLDAEVSGATSQTSLSYLCQVTPREQSMLESRLCYSSVEKGYGNVYRNLEKKGPSAQEKYTFTFRHKTNA